MVVAGTPAVVEAVDIPAVAVVAGIPAAVEAVDTPAVAVVAGIPAAAEAVDTPAVAAVSLAMFLLLHTQVQAHNKAPKEFPLPQKLPLAARQAALEALSAA